MWYLPKLLEGLNIKVTFIFAFVTNSDIMTPVLGRKMQPRIATKHKNSFSSVRERSTDSTNVSVRHMNSKLARYVRKPTSDF